MKKTIIKIAILLLPIFSFSQKDFVNSQNLFEKQIEYQMEGNDCSVRALAIGFDLTYYSAMQLTYKIGRKRENGMNLRNFVRYTTQNYIMNSRVVSMISLTKDTSVVEIQNDSKYDNMNLMLVTNDHIFNYKNNVVYGNTKDNKIKDVKWILVIKKDK